MADSSKLEALDVPTMQMPSDGDRLCRETRWYESASKLEEAGVMPDVHRQTQKPNTFVPEEWCSHPPRFLLLLLHLDFQTVGGTAYIHGHVPVQLLIYLRTALMDISRNELC